MKHLKKLLIFWAAVSGLTEARACSSYLGPEGYRIGLFLPYTYYKPWLGMLQYDLYTSYDVDISLATQHDRDLNCMEWKNYCGNGVKKEDIWFVMYEMPAGYFLEVINAPIDQNKTEAGNTFIRWMLKKEHAAVLRYMQFAKSSETISMQRMDPWDEDITDFDDQWGKYYDEGYAEMRKCTDAFLRQRWAFQFNRRHAYGAAQGAMIEGAMEVATEEEQKSDLVKGWTYAYMSKLDGKNAAERNVLLAKAFDLTQDKKYFAMKYFSSPHLQQTIEKVNNDSHLAAVVYGLAALNRQDECMDLIRKIMQNDVNSEIFELVITREVQKIEDQLMTEKLTGFHAASGTSSLSIYYEKDLLGEYGDKKTVMKNLSANSMSKMYFEGYAKMLLQILEKLLADKKIKNSEVFQLAASHLNWCLGNVSGMQKHIGLAARSINAKHPLYPNLCIEKNLLHTIGNTQLDQASESLAYEAMMYMEKNRGYDVQNLYDQFCTALVAHYEKTGELYKATLLMPKIEGLYRAIAVEGNGADDYTRSCNRYFAGKATDRDADQLMAFFDQPQHSPFEKYLSQSFARDSAQYDQLMEWVGSVYIRSEKWEKALRTFGRVDKKYWDLQFGEQEYEKPFKNTVLWEWTYYPRYLDANPFSAKVTSNHTHSKADTVHYNKLTFTKKWLSLRQQSTSVNKKVRDNALLQMANARYNMTWYGNAWILWRNEWSGYENKYWPGFEKEYYACSRAHEAYQQLYRLTANQEIKARCCVMLALCERNKAYYEHRGDYKYKYGGSAYLDLFMKQYNSTSTYEELMSTCYGEEEFVASIKRDERQ